MVPTSPSCTTQPATQEKERDRDKENAISVCMFEKKIEKVVLKYVQEISSSFLYCLT
jgi:spore maturation protein CgeB